MISIILATHNRAGLLPRAINSVLRQTSSNWELIIVDDGSTDETVSVIDHYRTRSQRICYIYQENAGLAAARNAGIAQALGEFITFLDSDDEYLDQHLELRERTMQENPELLIVSGGVEITGGSAYVPDLLNPGKMIAIENCDVGGTFFMRKHVAVSLRGFRSPDFGTDHDFMNRARNQFGAAAIGKVSFPTYVYHRETSDSMCTLEETGRQMARES